MIALTQSTLPDIPAEVATPRYDRATISAGIVHFGVGNFHRSHQALYLDDLMNSGHATDWGICGVGVLPNDARMRDVLEAQSYLYTLTLKHPDGRLEPRVVGSMVDYLFAPDDPEAVVHKLADPATRIVSLTVTEGGYNNHPVTGDFNTSNPEMIADSQSDNPSTVFGLIVEGLRRRRIEGIPPFTVMSCDNIQSNGNVAKAAFVAFARMRDGELADWIASSVAFPNSMVDRITPATTPADRGHIRDAFGVDDGWPVLSEPFRQWVLEDHFPLGRPPFELAGVQMVEDVMPYELMKLRLLNISHQALTYFGYLAGYRFAHEAATDPDIQAFVRAYMDSEGTPTLLPVAGIDLDQYKDQLLERFSNSEVRDTLARLCADSSNRIPKWLVPVIRENLQNGGEVDLAAAIVASWARYAEGVDLEGNPIDVVDPLSEKLTERAMNYQYDELAFLRDPDLFGTLVNDERFVAPYRDMLRRLHDGGSIDALRSFLTRGS